jgi:hypothetical protein
MKPAILEVKDMYGDTVEMGAGSMNLSFSRRSVFREKKDLFALGKKFKVTIEEVKEKTKK